MRLDELDMLILNSAPVDWERLESGPTFLSDFMVGGSGVGDKSIVDVQWHTDIAVYRQDIDIRLAWGYDPDFGERNRDYGFEFPDPSQSPELCDVFYRGSLVRRFSLVRVDGGRAVLPAPTSRRKPGTPEFSESPEDYESLATEQEAHIARLPVFGF